MTKKHHTTQVKTISQKEALNQYIKWLHHYHKELDRFIVQLTDDVLDNNTLAQAIPLTIHKSSVLHTMLVSLKLTFALLGDLAVKKEQSHDS